MKRELELVPTGFEDEPTVIDVTTDVGRVSPVPPALPFSLVVRKKAVNDHAWIMALDPAARAVLERATMPAPNWPFAGRLPGAVAMPTQKIPAL